MLLVIMAHFHQHSLNGVTAVSYVNILGTFRIPLFFFISGFVAATLNSDKYWLKSKISKRFTMQFVPTIVMLIVYCLFFSENIKDLLFSTFKGGYWFTIANFEAFVVYAVVAYLLYKLRLSLKWIAMTYFTMFLLGYPINWIVSHLPGQEIFALLALQKMASLIGFFFLGAFVRLYYPLVECYLNKQISGG